MIIFSKSCFYPFYFSGLTTPVARRAILPEGFVERKNSGGKPSGTRIPFWERFENISPK